MTAFKKIIDQFCLKLCVSFVFFLMITHSAMSAEVITGFFDENTLGSFPAAFFNVTDPVKIYYEIYNPYGDGYPLFLLHGGFADSQKWFNAKQVLSQTYKVIAVDTREHGQSGDGELPISYDKIANDVMALTWELASNRNGHPAYYDYDKKVHVVGWSDGGIAAINICLKANNVVNKAIFFGVNLTPDGLVDPDPTDNPFLYNRILRPKNRTDEQEWETFRNGMWAMWTADSYIEGIDQPFEVLNIISAKTAVFAATKDATINSDTNLYPASASDNVVYINHMKKIADSINVGKTKDSPDWCDFTELPGLVHGAPGNSPLSNTITKHEQADAFNHAVLKFLEQ